MFNLNIYAKRIFIFLCSLFFHSVLNASLSTVSTTNPHPNPGTCQANPGCHACSPGQTAVGSCVGNNEVSYCNDNYTTMTSGNSITVNTLPFILTESDPDPQSCGSITCNGGTTTCKVKSLPVLSSDLDAILTQWAPSTKLPATVTCRYYNPTCSSCFTSWDCSSCGCQDPPPPTPTETCATTNPFAICSACNVPIGQSCVNYAHWNSSLSCYVCN